MEMSLLPAVPELFLVVGTLVLLVFGSFKGDAAGSRLITMVAIGLLAIAGAIVVGMHKGPTTTFFGHFMLDGFGAYMKILVFIGSAGTLLVSMSSLRRERHERIEFPILILFSTIGMALLLSANSFLALYMALELMSLPLYVLAAYNRDTLKSTEAGLKYFVLGALASGMLLYGVSLVYGFTGSIRFDRLTEIFLEGGNELPLGALVGLVFISAGLAFKLGAVPFHMWTPDVYEGSPTAVTMFFATGPKIAAIGLTIRVFAEPFGNFVDDWQQILVFISLASMLLGAFAAIGQTNIKRLMAYSSIGHVGYALVGLAAGTPEGVYGVMVYMSIYLFMTLGTFACILAMRRDGRAVEGIDDFAGLGKEQPGMALMVAIFMFSLAGIPPLAGFFGKFYVFLAAVDAGLIWLAVIGVLSSVVGAFYYLRIVKLMYFDTSDRPLDRDVDVELRIVAGAGAIFTAFFVIFPGPILSTARAAAAALL